MRTNLQNILKGAAICLPAIMVGCSAAGPDMPPPGDTTTTPEPTASFTEAQIYERQIVDLKKYVSEHPQLSAEQAITQLNRPIKVEPGHFLYPKDLRLPDRCSSSLDQDAPSFVTDFETCIVKPMLFDPASEEMLRMVDRYLLLTDQVQASPWGWALDTPTIHTKRYTTSSCLKSYNCRRESKTGTKCEVQFFGLRAGCGAYMELYEVCSVCEGKQTCTEYENSDGGGFTLCGDCICG